MRNGRLEANRTFAASAGTGSPPVPEACRNPPACWPVVEYIEGFSMRKQSVPLLAQRLPRFRLGAWFVLTALWVGLCAVTTVGFWPVESTASEWATPGPALGLLPEQGTPPPLIDKVMASYAQAIRSHLSTMALFTAIPPAALLLSGWMLLWIARGFKLE
jgi:hypothetical protein